MGKWFGERFADSVMDKWGEFFELDRDKALKSFDRLKGYRMNTVREIIEAESYWSAYFVPALLLDDYFLANVVNTVKDDTPYKPDKWDHVDSLDHQVEHKTDVDLDDPDVVWDVYIRSAVEGNNALLGQASDLDLLFGDMNSIRFEFVQYILNNIGIVIYHFLDFTPFSMYVMNHLERCPDELSYFACWEWRMKHDREDLIKDLTEQMKEGVYDKINLMLRIKNRQLTELKRMKRLDQ